MEDCDGGGQPLVGTCSFMCSKEEAEFRDEKQEVSYFEAIEETQNLSRSQWRMLPPLQQRRKNPDYMKGVKGVKKFRRSAAGVDLLKDPSQMRPLSVLVTTVAYLLRDVFCRYCGSKLVDVYIFVEDRLRAARQDIVVQQLVPGGGLDVARIYAQMIRFYVIAGYLLSQLPAGSYSAQLHNSQLLGCLSTFIEIYSKAESVTDFACFDDIISCCLLVPLALSHEGVSGDLAAVYAAVIKGRGIDRLGLYKESCSYASFKKTLQIAAAIIESQWTVVFRLGAEATTIARCVVHGCLMPLRLHTLRCMNKNFGKGEWVSLSDLVRLLCFDDIRAAAMFCKAMNFNVTIPPALLDGTPIGIAQRKPPSSWEEEEVPAPTKDIPPSQCGAQMKSGAVLCSDKDMKWVSCDEGWVRLWSGGPLWDVIRGD